MQTHIIFFSQLTLSKMSHHLSQAVSWEESQLLYVLFGSRQHECLVNTDVHFCLVSKTVRNHRHVYSAGVWFSELLRNVGFGCVLPLACWT